MNESRSFPDLSRMRTDESAPLIDRRDTHHLARREDIRIGHATVRPSIRTVEGPGGIATAEPRVMQVLLALIDAAGSVVTREDLIHHCWKGQVVGDDSVNRAIKEVRKIAKAVDAAFEVETIPRIGYRLKVPEDGGTDKGLPETETTVALRLDRRALLAGGALTLLGTGAGLAWWNAGSDRAGHDRVSTLMERSRIAMRSGDPASEREAESLLEKAVQLAPDRADAWGLLALTRARLDEHIIDDTQQPLHRIDEAANRALELDANNADATAALALAVPYYGDWLNADYRFQNVIQRHPDQVIARDAHSFFLGSVGRMKESADKRMTFVDEGPPDANLHYRSVYAYWFLGDLERADRAAARGLEMWPRQAGNWFARLWILLSGERFDRALAFIDDATGRPPLPDPIVQTLRTGVSAKSSSDSELRQAAIAMLMGGVHQNVAAVINAIMLLNLLGAMDEVFAVSEAYYLEAGPIIAAVKWRPGEPLVPDQRRRKTNPLFTPMAAPMRADPRFLPLIQRMGLTSYWDKRGVAPDFLR